jgi:hypothetical protein
MDFAMVDCQVPTRHLMRFGAQEIPRARFLSELQQALRQPTLQGQWCLAPKGGIDIKGKSGVEPARGTSRPLLDKGL